MKNICFSLTYAKAAPDVSPTRETPIKRPPEKRYRKACAGKIKPLKNKVLSCHFQVKRKAMASHGQRRTPQRGRAAERTGTPRHVRAAALPVAEHPRQARAGKPSPDRKTGKPRTQTPHGAFSTPLCTNLSTGLSTGKGGKQRPSCQRVKI